MQRIPPSHSSHLKFQVNRINSFQVIAVGSWVRFLAEFWSFESKSTFNVESRYSDASWRRYRHQIWKRTNVLAWPAFSTANFVTAGVFWIWPQNSYLHVLSHCAFVCRLPKCVVERSGCPVTTALSHYCTLPQLIWYRVTLLTRHSNQLSQSHLLLMVICGETLAHSSQQWI